MDASTVAAAAAHFGFWSVVPTLSVLVLAVTIHRPIEALLFGAVIGQIILAVINHMGPTDAIVAYANSTLAALMDEDLAWVVLVCGAMGAMIGLLVRTGSVTVFMDKVAKRVHSRNGAIVATWLMGIAVFVDDYLNAIAVGSTMKRLTDRYKVSREMLAYLIDSTAAPVSVIIPISTWAVFFGKLLEDVHLAPAGGGLHAYISGIPYMFYAWLAVALVPLVALGKLPLIGPMKAAEARAHAGHCVPPHKGKLVAEKHPIDEIEGRRRSIWLFILPIASLVGFTLYFNLEFLPAIYTTLTLTLIAIIGLRILDHHDAFDTVLDGFRTMIEPLAIIFAAYVLKEINGQLGLTEYVLELALPYMNAQTLPFIIFAIMGLVAFGTGSSWGMFVIALPVIAELALKTNANIPLVIGATLSASTFGSHACLYADATVLTSHSCGCTSLQHALTQLPYAVITAILALTGFWLLA
ncbi:Na+/H+ antiporter NhaC family protein [Kordiimonas marina]|uniref:Na+/H+ antiporter NhaC family protein n=1 Tax=Kordiimonas marina TaxID=2872312 RepID=UPI001FF5F191|nr:Na+/H+ antiporter NhaC family protein [Kordiimonas marina]MCJ9430275.1 sodium:proton antiporter [Kordiimonas marina]